MAGEIFPDFPESNETAVRLDTMIELLTAIAAGLDKIGAFTGRYGPALDKAARLVDSPAARVASKLPGMRRPAPPSRKETRR